MEHDDWTIAGANGEVIRGSTDLPKAGDEPRAVVLLGHGFKGYKDYGFIPALGALVAQRAPAIVHRFNFSHSGMNEDVSTFGRPDLFENDTWNNQAFDLNALHAKARSGELPGAGDGPRLPIIWMGHSRGGASCLLAAGRCARDGGLAPDAIITIAAPAGACRIDEATKRELREQGFIVSPSARTRQKLRISRAWLDEIEQAPEDHDIPALARHITCPVLVAHGADDPTVSPDDAKHLAEILSNAELAIIADANHVFNTANPADLASAPSPQLAALADKVSVFVTRVGPLQTG